MSEEKNTYSFFYLDGSPTYKDKFMIRLNHDKFLFSPGFSGSFNIFPARLLGLNYIDYLRYCRDVLGADLIGKNRFVVPYFDQTKEVKMFVKLLNTRMKYIMDEHENPYEYNEENGEITRTKIEGYEDVV